MCVYTCTHIHIYIHIHVKNICIYTCTQTYKQHVYIYVSIYIQNDSNIFHSFAITLKGIMFNAYEIAFL